MSIPFTWVYLIHDPFTGLYKIGKSDTPDDRCRQLSNPKAFGTIPAAPTEYRLLEAWLCPEAQESELHKEFDQYRVRGEWFDLAEAFGAPDDPGRVEFSFGNHAALSSARRWYVICSADSDAFNQLRYTYQRTLATMRVMDRQLKQAMLLGFVPIRALPPAPVVEQVEQEMAF